MTSKITFSNTSHVSVLSPSDLAVGSSEWKYGRIPYKKISEMKTEHKLEVIVLKNAPIFMTTEEIIIDEDDIREGKRQTFKYGEISQSSRDKGRIALGTKFLKDIEITDAIFIILHVSPKTINSIGAL